MRQFTEVYGANGRKIRIVLDVEIEYDTSRAMYVVRIPQQEYSLTKEMAITEPRITDCPWK